MTDNLTLEQWNKMNQTNKRKIIKELGEITFNATEKNDILSGYVTKETQENIYKEINESTYSKTIKSEMMNIVEKFTIKQPKREEMINKDYDSKIEDDLKDDSEDDSKDDSEDDSKDDSETPKTPKKENNVIKYYPTDVEKFNNLDNKNKLIIIAGLIDNKFTAHRLLNVFDKKELSSLDIIDIKIIIEKSSYYHDLKKAMKEFLETIPADDTLTKTPQNFHTDDDDESNKKKQEEIKKHIEEEYKKKVLFNKSTTYYIDEKVYDFTYYISQLKKKQKFILQVKNAVDTNYNTKNELYKEFNTMFNEFIKMKKKISEIIDEKVETIVDAKMINSLDTKLTKKDLEIIMGETEFYWRSEMNVFKNKYEFHLKLLDSY